MKRLLIVDDEINMLVMLKKALTRGGMEVDTARTAEDAIKLASETDYDLALIDIYMKPVGGLELLGRLKEVRPEIQTIVITGYPSKYTERRSKELGAFKYLTKPVGIDELNAAVQSALSG